MQLKSKRQYTPEYYYTDANNVRITKVEKYEQWATSSVLDKIRMSLSTSEKKRLKDLEKQSKYIEARLEIENVLKQMLNSGEIVLHQI